LLTFFERKKEKKTSETFIANMISNEISFWLDAKNNFEFFSNFG